MKKVKNDVADQADNDSAKANADYNAQASGEEVRKDMSGHNSGQKNPGKNPALIIIFEKTHRLIADRKQINLAIRELRADAKKTHNVSSGAFNDELRLQQLDKDVRIQREQGLRDLQHMLGTGFQLALDLAEENAEIDPEQDPVAAGKREKAKLKTV